MPTVDDFLPSKNNETRFNSNLHNHHSPLKFSFQLQVCHDLGIICETDYFGLLYAPTSHMPHTAPSNIKQWINLRNPLDKRHHRGEGPIMLELRIKFWVPGHLILQENVR